MLGRFWTWLAGVFAEHALLKLIGTVPVAYFAGLGVQFHQEATAMLDVLPPLFWPILAGLVLVVTGYHGLVGPIIKTRREKERGYWDDVQSAYAYVSEAYKPEIMDPAKSGNPHAIKWYAQNRVDRLRPLLIRKRGAGAIPEEIDVANSDSLRSWYNCLRREKARMPRDG